MYVFFHYPFKMFVEEHEAEFSTEGALSHQLPHMVILPNVGSRRPLVVTSANDKKKTPNNLKAIFVS